jgi:hypothetical protein
MEIELPAVTRAASDAPTTRLFFIDHLRVALIILVALHHIAVIYAANSPFYYLEPAYQDVPAVVILVFFELFNQAYFMGFFFLLSGYFTPGSFDRKGPRLFLRDRLVRLGVLGARRKWLQTVPGSMGKAGLGAALGVTLLLLPLAFSGKTNFLGRGHWQSAAYALWDSAFAVGMCLALTTFFRRFFNRQGRLGRLLTRSAFTVYVIHIPVIVLLALALRGLQLEHLLKFSLLALLGVPLCFAVAWLIGRITLAAQILYLARRVENGT